jgi:DNA-binding MarR family transcriptional regulator
VGRPADRAELEAAAVDEIRGWQTDQDIFDELVAELAGRTRTEMRVIDIVQRLGPITAGQLAADVRLTSGAVTAVVDRLEAVGYVRRLRDTVDRRRVLIEVTPKVLEASEPVFRQIAEEGFGQMAAYTDEELATIFRFIREGREFLHRHTARVQAMIAERDRKAANPG